MTRKISIKLEIAEELWNKVLAVSQDSGLDPQVVVTQAVFELVNRLKYADKNDTALPTSLQGLRTNPQMQVPKPIMKPQRVPTMTEQAGPPVESNNKGKRLFLIDSTGKSIPINKDHFIVGRSKSCDMVIVSSKVSRQHAGVSRESDGYFIEDLGSANGIWHNGEKIQRKKIADGAEFAISEEVLKFVFR